MSEHSPWAKRCPRGHTTIRWLKTKGTYRCKSCASNPHVDNSYYTENEIRVLND